MNKQQRMKLQRSDEATGNYSLAEIYRTEDVDWKPLEQFFCGDDAPEVAGFMFMGHIDRHSKDSIRMYKHIDTRRYLMLDEGLDCYRLKRERHVRISRATAIYLVYSPLDAITPTVPVPRRGVFPSRYNTKEALWPAERGRCFDSQCDCGGGAGQDASIIPLFS